MTRPSSEREAVYRERIENVIRPGNRPCPVLERIPTDRLEPTKKYPEATVPHLPADETADRVPALTEIGTESGSGGRREARRGGGNGKRRHGYRLLGGIVSLSALAVLAHLVPLAGHFGPAPGPAAEQDGLDGGEIPSGRVVTPFDTRYPAVARLSPDLLKALQEAGEDAKRSGITLRVTSGWRSEAHQQRLLDAAVRKYGSLEKARQFVNTPEKSAHVRGEAVDIGPTDADDWLIQHGARYGLCQTYANEMWHFELRTTPGGTCPVQLGDATD